MTIVTVRESRHMTEQKRQWPEGRWTAEPDKVQARHVETDFPVLVVRHEWSGHLCGYVGVPEWHPAFQQHYDKAEALGAPDEDGYRSFGVHGGLTFAGPCMEDAGETGICHIPEPGHPDRIWWLGFDCAHCYDATPSYRLPGFASRFDGGPIVTYKTVEYVLEECEGLARALARIPLTAGQRKAQAREFGRMLAHSLKAA